MSTRAAGILAVVAAAALAVQAHAEAIRFDNPAGPEHFVWYGGTVEHPIALEVTGSAASQTGAPTGDAPFLQANVADQDNVSGSNGRLEVGGYADLFLLGVEEGAEIPTGNLWGDFGLIFHPALGSELTAGVDTYLGIRFSLDTQDHYGWIGVTPIWIADPGGSGQDVLALDAFAWAYETQPGVPIEAGMPVPEPGTLAALALGAVVALRGKRN
jgi:hypothetical protein